MAIQPGFFFQLFLFQGLSVLLIAMKDVSEAYNRMLKGDVRYRFVIDMATL